MALKLLHKIFKLVAFFCTIILISYLLLSSRLYYEMGNFFFGKVENLYNLNIATFFFERSTKPILGKQAPYAYHQLSRTYFIRGDLKKSLNYAKKELELYPDHKSTNYIIGLTLGYMDREVEAIDAFTKYLEYDPDSWAARNDKAWLQFRIGDIDGALTTIEPVITSFKYTPWVQNTYCALLIAKKRYGEALEPCTNAKETVNKMSESEWGHAYPGNDPRLYSSGLNAMKISIDQNLELINKNLKKE